MNFHKQEKGLIFFSLNVITINIVFKYFSVIKELKMFIKNNNLLLLTSELRLTECNAYNCFLFFPKILRSSTNFHHVPHKVQLKIHCTLG